MTLPADSTEALVRPAAAADGDAMARIYNHYVAHTIITFEEEPITGADMASRLHEVTSSGMPWLVAEVAGAVAGYAYATRWKGRSAYRFSAESTVYLAPDCTGRGLGTRLYERLFAVLREQGLHVVIGGIALPNDASIALHERLGMVKVAHFRETGFKLGRWIDVAYWQRTL